MVDYAVDPPLRVRVGVEARDGARCVCCGTASGLTFQHRITRSQGGRGSYANGLCACAVCNARFEADLQQLALRSGWKVYGWVGDASRVPYFSKVTGRWYAVATGGPWRRLLTTAEAEAMLADVYGPFFPSDPERSAA